MEPAISFNDLQNFGDQIRVCETSDDLSLYHYKNVDENSSPLLKQVRGVVFDKSGNLVMRGFPYTPEYVHDDPDLSRKIGQVEKYKICLSFEGTIIRVFWFKDRWFVSTHKKLFANESYWAVGYMSFEEQFQHAIESNLSNPDSLLKKYMESCGQTEFNYNTFFDVLDKTKQYMFLITPILENRIVCAHYNNISVPFHVGTFVNNKFTMDENIGLPTPPMKEFKSVEDLSTFVAGCYPFHTQGVLLMSEHGFYKVVSKMYTFFHSLRGNQPNIILRYLELLNDEEKLNYYVQLYPEFVHRFIDVQNTLNHLCKKIHDAYVRRFVKKQFVFLPKLQFLFLKKVHNTYVNTSEKTTIERVSSLLLQESPVSLYRMINS